MRIASAGAFALALAPAFIPVAACAAPSQDWSAMMGARGLSPTEAEIAALPAPTPEDLFALGGLRFLTAIEAAFQARWRMGVTQDDSLLPVFRFALPPNPAPQPFDPAVVEDTFAMVNGRMEGARAALARIPEGAEVGLPVDLGQIWFDVNANGRRDAGEGLMSIAGQILAGTPDPDLPGGAMPVRFDTADVAWLSAYTHLLSGISDLVLAVHPTEDIRQVIEGEKAMAAFGGPGDYGGLVDPGMRAPLRQAMMTYLALKKTPIAEKTRAARAEFLAMVRDERRFWTLADAETDDDREFIPNARQHPAFGDQFPEGADVAWLAVLGDFEKLLNGELLLPHWALPDGAGINLGKLLTDPEPVDPVTWVHGIGLLPYAEKGPVITGQEWLIFDELVSGNGIMFAVYLN